MRTVVAVEEVVVVVTNPAAVGVVVAVPAEAPVEVEVTAAAAVGVDTAAGAVAAAEALAGAAASGIVAVTAETAADDTDRPPDRRLFRVSTRRGAHAKFARKAGGPLRLFRFPWPREGRKLLL